MTRLSSMTRCLAVIGFLSATLVGFAHAETKSIRDDFDQRVARIKTIVILTPDFSYYDSSFSGVKEKNDEQSNSASQNIVTAIKDVLTTRGFAAKVIAREGERKQSLEEIAGLFETIAVSYRRHVSEAQQQDLFPHKAASFDYSVGPIGDILDAEHADGLVLVVGGGAGMSFMNQGGAVILAGLADRTGALLWYELYIQQGRGFFGTRDPKDPEGMRRIIETIFAKMPEVRK